MVHDDVRENRWCFCLFKEDGKPALRKLGKVAHLCWTIRGASKMLSDSLCSSLLDVACGSRRITPSDRACMSMFAVGDTLTLYLTRVRDGNQYVLTQAKAESISALVRATFPAGTFGAIRKGSSCDVSEASYNSSASESDP